MDLESALTVVGTDGYDACAALSILSLLDGHQQVWPGGKNGFIRSDAKMMMMSDHRPRTSSHGRLVREP